MPVVLLLWIVILVAVPRDGFGQDPQLRVEIRSGQHVVRAGDEIPITFLITNVGTTSYEYTDRTYDRSGRMGEYQLRAHNERGAPVPDPRTLSGLEQGYIGGGRSTVSVLQPG